MRVKIVNELEGVVAWGTELWLNGNKVPELVNVEFHHRVTEPAKVLAEINAEAPLTIELDAEVTVHFLVGEGYKLETATDPINGKTTYRAVCE